MKRIGLIGVVALAACHTAPPPETAAFHEPASAAAFLGWTHERPRAAYPLPVPYLAVANQRGDELRLIDLATTKPVMSPGFAFPLSIPTLPRPSYLAASSLRDGGADLLAVAGVGAIVEIVSTWEDGSAGPGNRVVRHYDLSGVAGDGAEILSMIATPVPGAPAGTPPVAAARPGSAWLIVGFSGSLAKPWGKLVILEFDRAADGSVVLRQTQVEDLGFDPVSLAVSPDLFHLYAATPDVVTDFTTFTYPLPSGSRQVLGVAEVDMSGGIGGAAAPWPVRGLGARAPTTLVAAAILGERVESKPDVFGAPSARVYAALDPSGCGFERPIDCGIAVIDPAAGGLAPDIAPPGNGVPAQPYRAPILVPAVPMTLAIAMPPVSGPLQCVDQGDPCSQQTIKQPLMRLYANGERWTTAIGAVGGSDGKTYVLDLGRSGPASDVSLLNSDSTRTAVIGAQSLAPLLPDGTQAKAGLALYGEYPQATPLGLTSDATKMTQAVIVTPGFTRGETWTIVWQGRLPSLAARSFVLRLESDGSLSLAFQSAMGNQWDVDAYVGDPRLGIRAADSWSVGDLAQFDLPVDQFGTAGNPCALATGTSYEAPIASIIPPDPSLYPGGALKLVMPSGPASDPFGMLCLRDWLVAHAASQPNYLFGPSGGVRASGLVLSGSASGYIGRPPLLSQNDVDVTTKRFNLAWQDESTVFGEDLVRVRKARRFFYANDVFTGKSTTYPASNGDYLAAGPALRFIVGPMCSDEPPGTGQAAICPPARMGDLRRDSILMFTTRSGVLPTSRQTVPLSLPSWAVVVDRSQFPDGGDSGSVFYVTYHQDAVLILVPGQTLNISSTLR